MKNLIPIDSEEKEQCIMCILGLIYEPYMTEKAHKLYLTLSEQDKQKIKFLLKGLNEE